MARHLYFPMSPICQRRIYLLQRYSLCARVLACYRYWLPSLAERFVFHVSLLPPAAKMVVLKQIACRLLKVHATAIKNDFLPTSEVLRERGHRVRSDFEACAFIFGAAACSLTTFVLFMMQLFVGSSQRAATLSFPSRCGYINLLACCCLV